MHKSRLVRISKYLSKHLRHNPERLGLHLGPGGWVGFKALLKACKRHNFCLTREQIEYVVAYGDKPRFSISQGKYIRANYGHSAKVDLQYVPAQPPPVLFHGTAEHNVESILRDGIKSMGRQYVHLSQDAESARKVGQRHGKPAILRIDTKGMIEDHYSFFFAEAGIWLTEQVPVKYITFFSS